MKRIRRVWPVRKVGITARRLLYRERVTLGLRLLGLRLGEGFL